MKNIVIVITGREIYDMVFKILKFNVAKRVDIASTDITDNHFFSNLNEIRLSTIPVSVPRYAPILASRIAAADIIIAEEVPLFRETNESESKLLVCNAK
ncbi:hypothetical protein [Pseudescherichia sp.]|uniref:hypothetical protein n=1 Tax=Pseudescherichia sp. TaxID=2055881 RepID=UPI00289B9DB1|nr:hypothetical protein [Pseudescherichia sp.]